MNWTRCPGCWTNWTSGGDRRCPVPNRWKVCQRIVAQGGNFFTEDNQPTLKEEFAPSQAVQIHGGRVEQRRLWASAEGYTTGPSPGMPAGAHSAYAVTSLPPEEADAVRLLNLWRGHWGIENRVHWVRDVTLDEDRSQVRTGAAPQIMAGLRNLTISLLRLTGEPNIAAALRRHAAKPSHSLTRVGAHLQ